MCNFFKLLSFFILKWSNDNTWYISSEGFIQDLNKIIPIKHIAPCLVHGELSLKVDYSE